MANSWRKKAERAQHHLSDLGTRVRPIEEPRIYTVTEALEPYDEGQIWVHRLDLPQPDDPLLPIIAGELMFNLRSGLDHLAVALAPEDRANKAEFPLFTDDLDAIDPGTGKYLHPDLRGKWRSMTAGMPEGAMPVLELVQPYKHGRVGRDPQNAALARLAAFQNADKHRHLVIVASGVTPTDAWFVGSDGHREAVEFEWPEGYIAGHEASVGMTPEPLPPDVHVEIEGTLRVQIGDATSDEVVPLLESLGDMITDTVGVFDLLERFLP